jgi:myo-inositol-1(or 4)-monophosphatase
LHRQQVGEGLERGAGRARGEGAIDLAAARVIIESSGGRFCKIDGSDFFLNDYLDGQKIEDPLLATSAELLPQIRACLKPIS